DRVSPSARQGPRLLEGDVATAADGSQLVHDDVSRRRGAEELWAGVKEGADRRASAKSAQMAANGSANRHGRSGFSPARAQTRWRRGQVSTGSIRGACQEATP